MTAEDQGASTTARDHVSLERSIERLESSLRARDAFLRVATHELRGPLAAIQLQADTIALLARQGASLADVDARAARVSGQVQRLARLLEEVLDLTRASSGRLQIQPGEVDLRALVNGEVTRAREDLRRAGCEARVVAPDPVVGPWDQARLEHAFGALLTLAMKTGGGEPIEVRVSRLGEEAQVEVRWTGTGLATSQVELVGGEFEQAVSGAAPGANVLALWLARVVARAHGGDLALDSTNGVLSLPLDRQKVAR